VNRALALLVPIASLASTGCGGADCEDWPEGRPKIVELRFIQQSPGNPYELEFGIDFMDTDGDIYGGRVHMFVNGDEAANQPMKDVFEKQVPPIDAGATAGELELVVKLGSTVEDDQRIEIGFVLEDAAGQESNDPKIELQAFAPGG
jgi:hypothetical protein